MATPARLAYANLLTVSGVTITSSAEATGYVDDNLASAARWKKWRSTTTTGDQWVKFDLGAARSFNLARRHQLQTARHRRDAEGASELLGCVGHPDRLRYVQSVPSTNLTGVLCDWIAQQNLQWIRFYFTNVGAVSDYVGTRRGVRRDVHVEPNPYFAPGGGLAQKDLSVSRFAIGGQRSTVVRSKYHEASGIFQLQSASGRDTLRTVIQHQRDRRAGYFHARRRLARISRSTGRCRRCPRPIGRRWWTAGTCHLRLWRMSRDGRLRRAARERYAGLSSCLVEVQPMEPLGGWTAAAGGGLGEHLLLHVSLADRRRRSCRAGSIAASTVCGRTRRR
jgi:hypothetical protein